MQPNHRPPAEIYFSERPTKAFIKAVDPDDPNDEVFAGFVNDPDPVEPQDSVNCLGLGTNRLADSEDLLEPASGLPELRLAQYDPGPDHRHTAGALFVMMGYLLTVGILLCS